MEFDSYIGQDENILWQGKGVPSKSGKGIVAMLIIILFAVAVIMAVALSWNNGKNDTITGIIFILIALVFVGLGGYTIIYNTFIKSKKVKSLMYCLTDKKAMIYDTESGVMKKGYLDKFAEFRVDNFKNNYGDVYMGIVYQPTDNSGNDVKNLATLVFKQDTEDMNVIVFQSVQSPYDVLRKAKEANQNLVAEKQ